MKAPSAQASRPEPIDPKITADWMGLLGQMSHAMGHGRVPLAA
jgi:hypothetical protein